MIISISTKEAFLGAPILYEKVCPAVLMARLSLKSNSSRYSFKEGVRKTYCQVVNELLCTNPMYDIIAEMDSETASFVKTSTMLRLELANDLLAQDP